MKAAKKLSSTKYVGWKREYYRGAYPLSQWNGNLEPVPENFAGLEWLDRPN